MRYRSVCIGLPDFISDIRYHDCVTAYLATLQLTDISVVSSASLVFTMYVPIDILYMCVCVYVSKYCQMEKRLQNDLYVILP